MKETPIREAFRRNLYLLPVFTMLCLCLASRPSRAAEAANKEAMKNATGLNLEIGRHTFYRGEEVRLVVKHSGSADSDNGMTITADLGGLVSATGKLQVATGGEAQAVLRLPTTAVKAGEYALKANLMRGTTVVASASVPIYIARRPNADEMPVWLWPHQAFNDSVKKFDARGRGILDWWHGIGLNSFTFAHDADGQRFFEYSLSHGMSAGILPVGGLNDIDLKQIDDPDAKYIGAYSKDEKLVNPFHPAVARQQDGANRKLMEAVRQYPHLKYAFFNSELLDGLGLNRNKAGVQALQERVGFTAEEVGEPKFVAPGVVADGDRKYLLNKYLLTYGNGFATANLRAAEMVHRYRSDVVTMNDPFRSFALLDSHPGIDALGSWTYVNPDPKLMLFIETLRAACKPQGKIPFSTVTLLNYPGVMAPTKDWMMMGPGRLTVTTWINLSRAPRMLSYYFSSGCDPFSPRSDEDLTKEKKISDFELPPSTFEKLKTLSKQVIKPYGPLLRNLDNEPRRVAVLSSEAARVYGKSPTLLGHYPNMQIYHFYTLLAMAHLQADVLFDESVERFGLDDYDVLVLPKCDVLTESVYNAVLKFQKRGGIVIADQYLGPQIPGAIKFDFDFTYRDKVTADAIVKNQTYAKWNDQLKPGSAEMRTVQGVTALDDQKIMESYAAQLKEGLKGKVEADVDCDSPTVLFNMMETDGVKYLAVINDQRTYDERVGQYKAEMDKLLPQTVNIRLRKWDSPNLFAYDMIERKPLALKKTDAGYEFTLHLSELGGTLVALYPRAMGRIAITAPKTVRAGQPCNIAVGVNDSAGNPLPGLQPLQVTITDPGGARSEYSDYYCARNGHLSLDFVAAGNDVPGTWKLAVLDLTSGLKAEKTFKLSR